MLTEPMQSAMTALMRGIRKNTKDGYEIKVYSRPHKHSFCINWNERGFRIQSEREAIRVRANALTQIANRTFDPNNYNPIKLQDLTFNQAILKWYSEISDRLSPTTRKEYNNKITRLFIPTFDNIDVRDLTASRLNDFHNSLKDRSPKTRNNIMSMLKSFIKHLHRIELIKQLPTMPKWERVSYKYRKVCSWEVFENIISKIPDELTREAIITMRLQWLRTGEVRGLIWETVLFDSNQLVIKNSFSGNEFRETTKTGNQATIHLHSTVKDMLWPRRGHPKAFVFTHRGRPLSESWLRKRFNEARDKVGYSKELCLYGATRHSSATEGYAYSKDIYAVKKALRHEDIRTTLKYTHSEETQSIIEPSGKVIQVKPNNKEV